MIKVVKRQKSSKNCFVCGLSNEIGFKALFYELENNTLISVADCREFYQSYPERLHGGITAALLDETMGRAIMIFEPDTWGVTVSLSIDYKSPIPLNQRLRVTGRITSNRRIFEAEGEIILEDGTVAAAGKAKYLKMALNKIAPNTTDDNHELLYMADIKKDIKEITEYGMFEVVY